MWGEKPKLFLSECYQFAVASPHALKFPKFSFCPTEELTYLLCLFFSLPPQQTSVAIFKGRKYLVNSSWLITPRNYFKALQFSRAHCVPAESSPLGSQIILKSLTGKVVLNNLLFCTSCSNHLYLKKKNLSLNTCTSTHHLQNHIRHLLEGLNAIFGNLFVLKRSKNQ